METQISSGLKITFLVHFILGALFGLVYLLIPEFYGELVGWDVTEPIMHRIVGAALIGMSISSWLAFKNPFWDRVKITVIMEIFWTAVAAVAMLRGMLFLKLPAIGWMNTIFMIAFAVLFILFYFREKTSKI